MRFSCVISGYSSVYTTWYKDGKELEEKGPVLKIENVQKSDQGEYTFTVENKSGKHTCVAKLTVEGRKRQFSIFANNIYLPCKYKICRAVLLITGRQICINRLGKNTKKIFFVNFPLLTSRK